MAHRKLRKIRDNCSSNERDSGTRLRIRPRVMMQLSVNPDRVIIFQAIGIYVLGVKLLTSAQDQLESITEREHI
jgi:hypothetical protein